MQESLSAKDFQPHIGSVYAARTADGSSVDLQLTEVTEHGSPGPDSGAPPEAQADQFSLVLTGPAEPVLSQQIYELQGPGGQPLELFVVPIGPDPTGTAMQYHIAFA